ncbi:MAG TPA: hypothetical protein VGH28_16220 [Polyangiaceae bacterium]|jgi:hypothetical protein
MTYRGLLAAIACVLACGAAGSNEPVPDGGGSASISFDQTGVLTLAPKEMATLDLSAAGLSNATLSLAGNYLDAFLDADAVDLTNGHGEVSLRAPSSPTTFSILAAAQQASARLDVSVSATGFATIRVTVDYHGQRPVPSVAASTFIETTCAQLAGKLVDGSPLKVATPSNAIVLDGVPTDGQVAVFVRIAHYATGCFDVASLTPAETRDVNVPVFDLPLDLADSSLETRFTFAPDSPDAQALQNYFGQAVATSVLGASFPSSTGEPSRLLDAMAAASGNATQFATVRSNKGWDATTVSWLSAHTPSMHDRALQWLSEAAPSNVGDLTGHLAGDASKPVFTPSMLGPLDAQSAGVSAPLPFAWTGQADDTLSISGSIAIVPSELACAAADLRAQMDVPTATGVADALATSIDCTGLASALVPQGYAFGQCDASCVAGLCDAAIASAWSAGASALSKTSDALTLSLSVAAPAEVTDTPQVQSYAGTWVGTFGYAAQQIPTKGAAKGAYGSVPN